MTCILAALMTAYTAVADVWLNAPKSMKLPTWFSQISWCGSLFYMLTLSDRFSHKGTLMCVLMSCLLTVSDSPCLFVSELIMCSLDFATVESNPWQTGKNGQSCDRECYAGDCFAG